MAKLFGSLAAIFFIVLSLVLAGALSVWTYIQLDAPWYIYATLSCYYIFLLVGMIISSIVKGDKE